MSDINRTASAFLAELSRGGGITLEDLAVSHIDRKQPAYHHAHQETAAEFLERVKRDLAALPEPKPEVERIEVEVPKVILVVAPRFVRAFAGFKREQPVFSWDFRLAEALNDEQADEVEKRLQVIGLVVERRPAVTRKASAF